MSLRLLIDGGEVDVAQVGPDYLIFRENVIIAPSTLGTLIIDVDGRVERHEIVFPNGAGTNERATFF